MAATQSTFHIGGRIVAMCDHAGLELEAALVATPSRATTRTTTAGAARACLAAMGITSDLAEDAAHAIRGKLLESAVRHEVVRLVTPQLGPAELFEGLVYDAKSRTYDGEWLYLNGISSQLVDGGLLLQALHLVSLLEEVDLLTPVTIAGAGRPATISAGAAARAPRTLRIVTPAPPRQLDDSIARRDTLLRTIRERAAAAIPAARPRLVAIELALAAFDMPSSGPLANPEAWSVERQIVDGDARGAIGRIDQRVRSRGMTLANRYLAVHAALVLGEESPRRIAEGLLAMGRTGPRFYELELLKARACLLGDLPSYARHLAKGLLEDRHTPEPIAASARAIVEGEQVPTIAPPPAVEAYTFSPSSSELLPPDTQRLDPPDTQRLDPQPWDSQPPSNPPRSVSPPPESEPPGAPGPIVNPTPILMASPIAMPAPIDVPAPEPSGVDVSIEVELPSEVDAPIEMAAPIAMTSPILVPSQAMVVDRGHLTDRPPPMMPPARGAPPYARGLPYEPEDLATLPMPASVDESRFPQGARPSTGDEARIAATRHARALGHGYLARYGVRLRCDVTAIDYAQRYLREAWPKGWVESDAAVGDVVAHGSLISEILARELGAYWFDVAPSELGYWAMFVPPRTRTWPIGRVQRFLALGHREKDLVTYYFDLKKRARG